MKIFEHKGKFHCIEDNKVYASFLDKREAEAFKESVERNELKKLTSEEFDRLLSFQDLLDGKNLEPLSNDKFETFKFVDTIQPNEFTI